MRALRDAPGMSRDFLDELVDQSQVDRNLDDRDLSRNKKDREGYA